MASSKAVDLANHCFGPALRQNWVTSWGVAGIGSPGRSGALFRGGADSVQAGFSLPGASIGRRGRPTARVPRGPGPSSKIMKTVMRGALALALLAGTSSAALAQDGPAGDHDRWHDAGERPRPPQRSE